ncbi:DMT family transporter [Lichenibacterium minor]|uniref:DMT family transporter n=1 Tax=Lichenibacterium minor TaxID=2316528 RepID=A0A4Q2U0I1_9HYPH|nr:DMT family transporter [Lichenibacterium minor]RYC29782.1 DMT family transporter [Lichenibacterium minor]
MTSLPARVQWFPFKQLGKMPSAASRQADRVLLGIGLMIGATFFLTLSNVLSKSLVGRYPVGEVMVFRSAVALALCCSFLLPRHGLAVFKTAKPGAHVARGLSQAVSQTFTVAALGLMPLASVTAIGFSAPLFAAIVAILVYRERADAMRWAVLVIGFLGVLIVTRPGAATLQLGALLALGNAVMYGSVTVAVRGMTKTESAPTLLMWQMSVMAAAHLGMLALGFRVPRLTDAALFAALGCCHVGAQYLWTQALARAPAMVVSPFYYFMLVWGIAFGALLFGEIPTPTLLVGAAVVVGSGLLLVAHETGLMRRLLGVGGTFHPRSVTPTVHQAATVSFSDQCVIKVTTSETGMGRA